ncbi:hypothetical protein HPB49_014455 [Dermacentor silvarum]|uniref:Uncharacterized protein n=1 Tax=Dermacentor silvarum TaxID=543639 RepID=A0ACB8E0W9_DERSI|nr:hypothetical protein HPB49_014455 [Dermacentor silvarum]
MMSLQTRVHTATTWTYIRFPTRQRNHRSSASRLPRKKSHRWRRSEKSQSSETPGLLIVFSTGPPPKVHVPIVFENYIAAIEVGGNQAQLALWGTAGQEDYDRLRPLSYSDTHLILVCSSIDSLDSLENNPVSRTRQAKQRCQEDYDWLRAVSYPDTDVILRCFSIDSPDSLENNPESGKPQVRHFCPNVPNILAGNKKDLCNDQHTLPQPAKTKRKRMAPEEGRTMVEETNAYKSPPGVLRQDQGRHARGVGDCYWLACSSGGRRIRNAFCSLE